MTPSHRENNELAELRSRLLELERQVRQIPSRPAQLAPDSLTIQVVEVAHSHTVGKAVQISSAGWALFTDPGESAYQPTRPLWGIISAVTSPDSYRLTINGAAETTSTTLIRGRHYTFANGDPVLLGSTEYPPYEASGASVTAVAISTSAVVVANDGRFNGLRSQDGSYAVVTHSDIHLGHYVVYAGVPSGQSPLALADPANPWKWTNVGIALFEVSVAGTWLVLVAGNHYWGETDNGDIRPAWLKVVAYNAGQRIYLSDTNPGEYATAEPAFKVYAGISSATYVPASPPDTPEYTGFNAVAVGQGVPYPIPIAGGGTGGDMSLVSENSVLAIKTVSGAKKIFGYLNAGPLAFLTQATAGPPSWTLPDTGTNKSMEVTGTTLFARVCGKRSAETAPTDKTFLRYDGTAWAPYGPLLSGLGHMLSHNGTDLVDVDASVTTSVLGVYGSPAAVPAAIQATADGQALMRVGGELHFTAIITLPSVTASDNGKVMNVVGGAWSATRDEVLGKDPLTASSIQGSLTVVKSNDGDAIKLSSAGIEIFDRSVSTSVPLIKIDIGHASLNATGRQLAVREVDVCDGGVAKKMLVPASASY